MLRSSRRLIRPDRLAVYRGIGGHGSEPLGDPRANSGGPTRAWRPDRSWPGWPRRNDLLHGVRLACGNRFNHVRVVLVRSEAARFCGGDGDLRWLPALVIVSADEVLLTPTSDSAI